MPRPYAIFAQAFVDLFVVVFPFTQVAALGAFPWLAVPMGALVGTVFGLVERTAVVSEDPFEHRIQDVPLSALCTRIERDRLEQLGAPERPAAPTRYPW